MIGFTGRVSRVALVHQYELKDRAERGAPDIKYARRALLGLLDKDVKELKALVMDLS